MIFLRLNIKKSFLALDHEDSQVSSSSMDSKLSPTSQVAPPSDLSDISLSTGMKKAYEDTELLKAIILPLEEQIHALKDKLRETDFLLNESEKRQNKSVLGVEALVKWLEGKSYDDAAVHLDNRQKELLSFSELKKREVVEDQIDSNYGTSEKINSEGPNSSDPKDKENEIYTSLLYTRIALLQKELHSTKNDLSSHIALSDKARKINTELRNQVYNANSEVVRIQKTHLSEITRISSVLTEEQKYQVSALKGKENEANENDVEKERAFQSSQKEKDDEDVILNVKKIDWDNMHTEINKVRALLGVGVEDNVVGGEKFRDLELK